MATEKRLIDANAVLEKYWQLQFSDVYVTAQNVRSLIQAEPTVDAVEVVHAQWKPYYDYFTKRQVGWICSNCSSVTNDLSNGETNFCPECGAKMDGGESE